MTLPTLEIYSSIECPYAYLFVYRLRQLWPEYDGRLNLAWRALSLEYVNQRPNWRPNFDAERDILLQIEPNLPYQPWARPDWDWPATLWPAFEALSCAQLQGQAAAFEMSWALRRAFFAESRNIALRHELLAVARQAANRAALDLERFMFDWDSGSSKASVLLESQRGWHERKVEGSPTLVLPDGSRFSNPAAGEIDYDEENSRLRGYTPYAGDPLQEYRRILDLAGGEKER